MIPSIAAWFNGVLDRRDFDRLDFALRIRNAHPQHYREWTRTAAPRRLSSGVRG
jgi:hypothetical protein